MSFTNTDTFTVGGTFIAKAGVTSVQFRAWSGGQGGRNGSASAGRAPGFGGQYNQITVACSPGDQFTIAVGAGTANGATIPAVGGDSSVTDKTPRMILLAPGNGANDGIGIGANGVGTGDGSIGNPFIGFYGDETAGISGTGLGGVGGGCAATATDDPGNTGVGSFVHPLSATTTAGTAGGTNSQHPAGSGGAGGTVSGAAAANGAFPGGGGGGGASGSGLGGSGGNGVVYADYNLPASGGFINNGSGEFSTSPPAVGSNGSGEFA